jgi:signal transduction histidine kinase
LLADGERDDDVPEPRKAHVTGQHTTAPDVVPPSRLLAAVTVAGVVHLLCEWALLLALGDTAAGARPTLVGAVALTLVTASWMAARARREGLDIAIRRAAAVFAVLPSLASLALGVPWIWAAGGGSLLDATLRTIPTLAAITAPAIAIALILEHSLWAVAARAGEREALARRAAGNARTPNKRRGLAPPRLATRLVRLVAGLGLASGLLILAEAMIVVGRPHEWVAHPQTWLALAGSVTTLILAALAAACAGLSPGRDVEALARRLDAIGWEEPGSSVSAAARPLASPVRVTSFDAVGELFRNLERLRARLAEDVGTYQRALDRTHAADAAKREFLAAVSHELRTPLNSILGHAQLLLESELSEAQAEDVRLILAGGRHLRELIEDILDLSMIESGELELRFAACDLGELVDELVDIHRAQIRGPALELVVERRGAIPPVTCDRKRIGQVLTNLLSNAIKFTEQGRVSVSLAHDARRGRISIAVADTGVGIASDELGTIFEEYRQVGARKRKLRGTGLGLAIARRIAEAHGGSLDAESQIGMGSTFTLRLPLEPPSGAPMSSHGAPA